MDKNAKKNEGIPRQKRIPPITRSTNEVIGFFHLIILNIPRQIIIRTRISSNPDSPISHICPLVSIILPYSLEE
jgi:hypothetical protein